MIRHALILAAGLGTRLAPLTSVRAKPAIPVGGEPMIRRILAWLSAGGVTDIVVNLHHLPHTIAAVVGDGSDLGVRVRYSWEQPEVLGSAGGPRLALPMLGAGTFFIINGDTLANVPLDALAARHAESGALVTLALTANTEPDRYGGVALDEAGAVTGFPRRGASHGSFHFVGVQVASAAAFDAVAPGRAASSIGGAYDALMAQRPGSVRGWVGELEFWDVGTPADYIRMSRAFGSGATRGRGVRVDPSARVGDSILWDDIDIGAHAALDGCIVTDGVRVPAGAHFDRAILMRGGSGAIVTAPLAD